MFGLASSRALRAARADAERYKADALSAAELVAKMHAAAVGEVRGPIRGVVEDVQDVRTCWLNAEARIKELEELPETVAAIRAELDLLPEAVRLPIRRGVPSGDGRSVEGGLHRRRTERA